MCAVAKHGCVVLRSQNDKKRANFQVKKSGLMTSFINGYCQTRYHLIDNLVLNEVFVTLYVKVIQSPCIHAVKISHILRWPPACSPTRLWLFTMPKYVHVRFTSHEVENKLADMWIGHALLAGDLNLCSAYLGGSTTYDLWEESSEMQKWNVAMCYTEYYQSGSFADPNFRLHKPELRGYICMSLLTGNPSL